MIPIFAVLVAVTLSTLVTRIATVALTLTGMSKESARFQARSSFTGAGFTTGEAEQVVGHPVRRRIIMLLMLLGNAGLITVVASLVSSLTEPADGMPGIQRFALLAAGLLLLVVLASSRKLDHHFSRIIAWALRKWTDIDARDYANLLNLSGGYSVARATAEHGDWMVGRTLGELGLRERGINVLGVHRQSGGYDGNPTGSTQIAVGDGVIVYGRGLDIASVCGRATTG